MDKFINNPDNLTEELLEGYVMAYSDQVAIGGENIIVRANAKPEDKVAIITLGGSGHEPALSGFVGEGMLDCSGRTTRFSGFANVQTRSGDLVGSTQSFR